MDNLLRNLVPTGWSDIFARAIMAQIAGFGALVIKEWLDTHEWDLLACAKDGAWVAVGMIVVSAVLLMVAPRSDRASR